MTKPHSHVLVDTNVIIEIHRLGCWRTIASHFDLDTVEKCVEECETGNLTRSGMIPVDTAVLKKDLKPKIVSEKDLVSLVLSCSEAAYLDAGEKNLLAYARTLKEEYLICSPDKKFISVGLEIGILDSFVSLEELLETAGVRAQLRYNFTRRWMEKVRTDLRLENL